MANNFVERVMKPKKKRIDVKAKGKTFERKIADTFAKWYESQTGIKRGFMRAPLSGATFGGKNRAIVKDVSVNLQQPGDILTPESCKFVIECKHYKTAPDISMLASGMCSQWKDWWKQVEGNAANVDKMPMLVIKYNNLKKPIVILANKHETKLDILPKYMIRYGNVCIISLNKLLTQYDWMRTVFCKLE